MTKFTPQITKTDPQTPLEAPKRFYAAPKLQRHQYTIITGATLPISNGVFDAAGV